LFRATVAGWNRFWFTPSEPATLGLIRILVGGMLFYTHLVWSLDFMSFFGPQGFINSELLAKIPGRHWTWSHFEWIHSPAALWAIHIAALVVFALLTLGLFSRVMSVLAYLLTVSYVNRVPLALFGLDDMNAMLAMYLIVGPCGDAFSLDRWLAKRRAGGELPERASVGANAAIRLIQVHLCIVYLFSAAGKLMGDSWWGGGAIWLSIGNLEYQSLDITWLVNYPLLVNMITHATVYWELSYCALVWPRLTRPLVLAMAVAVHLGIALCMGMMTFGLVMIIANVAFLSPALVRRVLDRKRPTAGQGRGADERGEKPQRSAERQGSEIAKS
jgi:hypothetical protein